MTEFITTLHTRPMTRGYVSTAIDEIEISYEGCDDLTVVITFKGDRSYLYTLPTDIAYALYIADSIGKTYNALVKGQYKGERL